MIRTFSTVAFAVAVIALGGPGALTAQSPSAKQPKKPQPGLERWRVELERKRAKKAEERRVKEARHFVESLRVSGNDVAVRVKRLTTELTWFRSLAAAQEEARRADRPILWIHALGEIDGFL